MAKPALGRGLEHLMKGDAVRRPGTTPGEPPQLSKGLQTLARTESSSLPASRKSILPPWFFFAADLLLLAFTVALLLNAPSPIPWQHWLYCFISTTAAGLFGILGVLVSANERCQPEKEKETGHIGHRRHHDA